MLWIPKGVTFIIMVNIKYICGWTKKSIVLIGVVFSLLIGIDLGRCWQTHICPIASQLDFAPINSFPYWSFMHEWQGVLKTLRNEQEHFFSWWSSQCICWTLRRIIASVRSPFLCMRISGWLQLPVSRNQWSDNPKMTVWNAPKNAFVNAWILDCCMQPQVWFCWYPSTDVVLLRELLKWSTIRISYLLDLFRLT